MVLMWFVSALVLGLTIWCGARRMAEGAHHLLIAMMVTALVSAGLCYAIGAAKTQGFLPGIIGYLFYIVMLWVAGGLGLGAILVLVARLFRRQGVQAAQAEPRPISRPWDAIGIGALAFLAVLLSALE